MNKVKFLLFELILAKINKLRLGLIQHISYFSCIDINKTCFLKNQFFWFWCKEYADYEYTLRPTDDFIRYIMRYGKLVKVISPLDVARKVRKQLLEAADVYADIDDSENSNVKE